jgi:hypothetical protein
LKLLITCAVRQILDEDVRVDLVHVGHSSLILTLVKHHLKGFVVEDVAVQLFDSILRRFLVIELDKTEALTLTMSVTLEATRNDSSVFGHQVVQVGLGSRSFNVANKEVGSRV